MAHLMTRRQVAEMLGLHQDSVSRLLHEGLGATVVEWGGHGREMRFSGALVQRWQRARACTKNAGRPCRNCFDQLEDSEVFAQHLLEVRHGAHENCWPDGCGFNWGVDLKGRKRK
jgi:phage terminase Nu1 subunit (DNA packaging protein)